MKPGRGDLIVLYSDGISEATNPAGTECGRDNLMMVAGALNPSSAETVGLQLVEAVSLFRRDRAPEDDETLIVLQAFPESLALT
jgi:phosphoserine phosphatase RsbU/P